MASQAITIGNESVSGSLQGIELRNFGQVYQGMMPKIRPMNSNILVVDGKRIDNLRNYDENLTTLVGTKKVEEFPNFEREELSFGMPKEFRDDTIFEDMQRFDPVIFINDNNSTLVYPQVLSNLSANDIDSYDGVIEPLTIRARASRNSIDMPYESHDVRGALSNAAEDVRRRGNLIVDYVFPVDRSVEPYLDEIFEQDTLGLPQPPFLSNPSDLAPPFEDGTDWEDQENYNLGIALKRYTLDQVLTDWDPANVIYYTTLDESLVEYDYRNLIVMHLNFEEAASSGDIVVDKTGNGNDGTLENAATVDLDDYPGYIANRGSLDLTTDGGSGTIDRVTIAHDSSLNATLGSGFSVSCWLNLSVISGTQMIFSKNGSSNQAEYSASVDSTGRVQFRVNDTTSTNWANNYIQSQSSILSAGVWYHITLTYGGGTNPATTLKVYVDGSLDAGGTTTSGTFTSPRNASFNLQLGSLDVSSGFDLRGKIASFEFYDAELTTDQINLLYTLQNSPQSKTYLMNYNATLGQVSTEQFFPRGSISARSGQFVNLEDSPGTDSIAYAGMKR